MQNSSNLAPRVRKCVFPVAGFGTRFLPATKACPKEMLPVIDRPLIQYAVDEAAAAGITEMIFVTGRNKRAIEDHFDRAYELEHELTARANEAALAQVRGVAPRGVTFSYIRQTEMRGLGHAVLCARPALGNEPFAVILPDDLIDGDPPALAQLLAIHARERASVVAVEPVPPAETHRYGVLETQARPDGALRVRSIVEKPAPGTAPSNLAVVGRYVLMPQIWERLARQQPGAGGEIQLTDAIADLVARHEVFACAFNGRRYDCGNKFGYLEAQFGYARKRPELWRRLRASLDEFDTIADIQAAEAVETPPSYADEVSSTQAAASPIA